VYCTCTCTCTNQPVLTPPRVPSHRPPSDSCINIAEVTSRDLIYTICQMFCVDAPLVPILVLVPAPVGFSPNNKLLYRCLVASSPTLSPSKPGVRSEYISHKFVADSYMCGEPDRSEIQDITYWRYNYLILKTSHALRIYLPFTHPLGFVVISYQGYIIILLDKNARPSPI
jgi:hypothetical protein